MKLTDLKCRKASATDGPIKLADGGGLFLHVYPNGNRLWRLAYRHGGKQKTMPFGPYPHISLAEARRQREAAKDQLRARKDPLAVRRGDEEAAAIAEAEAAENSFGAFGDLFLERLRMAGRSPATLKKTRWILEILSSELRPLPITDVRPRDVLHTLRAVEGRGHRETARRMRGVLSGVFRLAIVECALEIDPCAALKGALLPPIVKHHPAITAPKEFGALLRVIDGYDGHPTIRLALQILALTFPRPGELRFAEWSEIDDKRLIWTIPAERTKMRREHRIPLSRQAVIKFAELRAITGEGVRCFPSIRSLDSPLSDGALNAALRALGVDGATHVSHGFRSSASSMLNEYSTFEGEVIERALAHDDPDKIRRAYNRAEYWDERVRMMQWWADYSDKLRLSKATPMATEVQPDLFAQFAN